MEMLRFGQKGFVICDPFVFDHLLPDFHPEMEKSVKVRVERFGGECSDEEIGRLSQLAQKVGCEFIASMSMELLLNRPVRLVL